MSQAERDALMTQAVTLSAMLERYYRELHRGVLPNSGGLHDYACSINDFPSVLKRIFDRMDELDAEAK